MKTVQDTSEIIKIRAVVNKWLMDNFADHRKHLQHKQPVYDRSLSHWDVEIITKGINGHSVHLGNISINDGGFLVQADEPRKISERVDKLLSGQKDCSEHEKSISGKNYQFFNGDGVAAIGGMDNGSIDLLLTDPPYGISKAYVCEKQIPRRLRTNGRDFIMPKGNFGDWDDEITPGEWLDIVLPKVSGWFVSFCAHTQIAEYQRELSRHKFVAVGTLVWHKTNPVPFNTRHKPVNAWEVAVVGKRSGVQFNGDGVVHNVFTCKSPSPQSRVHPTQKPLSLMSLFVELFSQAGDTVIDPFAGSGTTLVAAAQKNRKAIGYEASEEHHKSASQRIKDALNGC